MKKLRDLLEDALEDPDALQGNLRATVSDILRLAVHLGDAIGRSVEASPDVLEKLNRLSPAIEMYVKLTRQADRFAQIDCRLVEARRAKKNPSPR